MGLRGTIGIPEDLQIPNPLSYASTADYVVANREFNMQLRQIAVRYLEMQKVIDLVRTRIQEDIGDSDHQIDVTLATVGSDGRLEKCLPSLYETVAYVRKQHNGIHLELHQEISEEIADITAQDAVTRMVHADAQDPLMRTGIFSHVEVKTFSSSNFLHFNDNPALKAWPSRIIDALPLGVDEGGLIPAAKRRLLSEIQGPEGKKLIALEDDRHKDARKIITRGGADRFQGKDVQHYDLEKREMYYDTQTGAAALKHGPLRTVQTLCYWKLMQALRLAENGEPLLQQTPTPTTEKLAYLADNNVLKFQRHAQMEELRTVYERILWWQHRAGYAHHVESQPVLSLSPNEAAELTELLRGLDARVREVAKKTGS
jgi:hypothetical protein